MGSTDNAEKFLQDINKFIVFKERQETAADFNFVRDYILNKMCEDKLFNQLSRGHRLAGSYADNAKICKPNEFDVLLLLQIMYDQNAVITKDNKRPGNVLINIKESLKKCNANPNSEFVYKGLKKMVDDNDFLVEKKVQSWIQSILTKKELHGHVLHRSGKSFKLSYRRSGPAHTFHVETGPVDFDMDLVPALIFSTDKWAACRKCPENFKGYWHAIPKPLKHEEAKLCKNNISWQGSYADAERQLITGKNNLKNSYRVLKKMKENQNNYGKFKSYFIKTMFLWEHEKQSDKFWNKPLGEIVLHMIEKWIEYLKAGVLPFFWDKKCNMLARENWKTMAEQMEAIHKNLKKYMANDPAKILPIFLTSEELKELEEHQLKIDKPYPMTPKEEDDKASRCVVL